MRVGIGIPTYNRLESLKKTIASIKANAGGGYYDLVVAVDGSSDGTGGWLRKQNINHICCLQNMGVCHAKNQILARLQEHDFIFIIEDDVQLIKPGMFRLYLRAIELFGIQHWNFLAPWQRRPARPNEMKDDLTMMFSKLVGGAISVYTREVIEKVGGFNPEFKGYGYGHCEYTLRASRAGLTTPWNEFAHLVNAEDYVLIAMGNGVKPSEQREKERIANLKVLRRTLGNRNIIHVPLEACISV